MKLEPVILQGNHIRLEPLDQVHLDGLDAVVRDGQLWCIPVTNVPAPDQLTAFLNAALSDRKAGTAMAFATCLQSTGQVVGSTRFMNASLEHRRVEIGYTFIAKSWQRSAVNTEAKWLMLNHAFETLKLNRVEFLTHSENTASRRAIKRLGAVEEGVLRQHMIMHDGHIRDSVIHAITRDQWPNVKQALSKKRQQQPQ